jgi:hypothetical protein
MRFRTWERRTGREGQDDSVPRTGQAGCDGVVPGCSAANGVHQMRSRLSTPVAAAAVHPRRCRCPPAAASCAHDGPPPALLWWFLRREAADEERDAAANEDEDGGGEHEEARWGRAWRRLGRRIKSLRGGGRWRGCRERRGGVGMERGGAAISPI